MLFSKTSDAVIGAHLAEKTHAEEIVRRQRFEVRHRLLTGDFIDLVKCEVKSIFADEEEAERVNVVADSHLNVFRWICEEVYQFVGAQRAFIRPDGSRDPVYDEIEREEAVDLIMQDVVLTLGACNDALIRVLPGPLDAQGRPTRPRIRVFRPHECTVIERADDPSQPATVIYPVRTPEGDIEIVVWTEREHYVIGKHGAREVPGAADSRNPLGLLPFVAVHRGNRADCFWDECTGQDQVEFTLQYLAGWSAVRHLMHQQSYRQLVAVNVGDDWRPPTKAGPGKIWKLGGPAKLEVLDLQSDPSQLVETLQTALAEHIAAWGLNPDRLGQNPGQAPPSGLALYLDRQRVIERRRKILPFVIEAERALAELYRAIWNWSFPDRQIDPDARFEVEVLEETVVLSPLEQAQLRARQLENYRLERELGLRTAAEQIAEDRGISMEEAEAILKQIAPRPEVFAYDQENGILTIDEIRAVKGLGPHPNPEIGRRTIPELRRDFPAMFGGSAAQE